MINAQALSFITSISIFIYTAVIYNNVENEYQSLLRQLDSEGKPTECPSVISEIQPLSGDEKLKDDRLSKKPYLIKFPKNSPATDLIEPESDVEKRSKFRLDKVKEFCKSKKYPIAADKAHYIISETIKLKTCSLETDPDRHWEQFFIRSNFKDFNLHPKTLRLTLEEKLKLLTQLYPTIDNTKNHSSIERANYKVKRDAESFPLYERETESTGSYFSFIFLQNPLGRLLSAYQATNKALFPMPGGLSGGYSYAAQNRVENSSIIAKELDRDNFHGFLKFLTNKPAGYLTAEKYRSWRSIFQICDICKTKWDFIGKLETYNDDLKFVLQKAGYNGDTIGFTKSLINQTEIEFWYHQIPKSTLKSLYETFESDFKILNYGISQKIWDNAKNW